MSIDNSWKHLNEEGDEDLSGLLQPGRISGLPSSDPLQKIRRSLLWNLILSVTIAVIYLFILYFFPFLPVFICIGITEIFTCWAIYISWKQYKELKNEPSDQYNVLQDLERHYTSIVNWVKLQERVALFVYPFAAAGGFMIGGMKGSGKSIEDFMDKPAVLIALLITLIILVPCCYYLAKWMNKKAFGKYANQLKANIEALKKED